MFNIVWSGVFMWSCRAMLHPKGKAFSDKIHCSCGCISQTQTPKYKVETAWLR